MKKRKASRAEIRERRQKVYDLRIRGLSCKAIGELLGVSHDTVARDLRAIAEENAKSLKDFDPQRRLAEAVKFLEAMRTLALQEFHEAQPGSNARAGFLNIAIGAEDRIIKLYQESGYLTKRLGEVEASQREPPVIFTTEHDYGGDRWTA